jgi:HEAT repeat protein
MLRVSPTLSNIIYLLIIFSLSSCCDKKQIPSYHKALFSNNAKMKNQAALDLARCGEAAGVAVPRLAELLYDDNVGVQSSAAYALRKIDTEQARAVIERVEAARSKRRVR